MIFTQSVSGNSKSAAGRTERKDERRDDESAYSRSLAAARTLSIRRHDALRFLLAQWLS